MRRKLSLIATSFAIIIAMFATAAPVSAATGVSLTGEGTKSSSECVYKASNVKEDGKDTWKTYSKKTRILKQNYIVVKGKKYLFQWKKMTPAYTAKKRERIAPDGKSYVGKMVEFNSMRNTKVYNVIPNIKGYKIVSKKVYKSDYMKTTNHYTTEKNWKKYEMSSQQNSYQAGKIQVKKIYKKIKGKKTLWRIKVTYPMTQTFKSKEGSLSSGWKHIEENITKGYTTQVVIYQKK